MINSVECFTKIKQEDWDSLTVAICIRITAMGHTN